MLIVVCPKCGGRGRASDIERAARAKCRKCGVVLDIEGEEPEVVQSPPDRPEVIPYRPPPQLAPQSPYYPPTAPPPEKRTILDRLSMTWGGLAAILGFAALVVWLNLWRLDPATSTLKPGQQAVLFDESDDTVPCYYRRADGELVQIHPTVGFRVIVVSDEDSGGSTYRKVRIRGRGEDTIFWTERRHLRPAPD